MNRERAAAAPLEEEASLLAAGFTSKASSLLAGSNGSNGRGRVSDELYFAELGYVVAGAGDEKRFGAALARLEARVGQRMNGPGRADCLRAFTQNPARVKSIIAEVLSRLDRSGFSNIRSPLGLVVRMVADGDDYREPDCEEQECPELDPETV